MIDRLTIHKELSLETLFFQKFYKSNFSHSGTLRFTDGHQETQLGNTITNLNT